MKLDSKKKIQAFTALAICNYLISIRDEDLVPSDVFDKLFKFIDINNIDDNRLVSDIRFRDKLDWNKMNTMKMVRVLAKDISLLEKIDVSKFKYSVMDIYPLLLIYPELVDFFEINFDTLTWYETIKMLECDEQLADRIDLSKYKPNKLQSLEVIRLFFNNDKIIGQIDLKNLDDHFVIRKLLKKTGDKHIDKIDVFKLKSNDWLDILEHRPDMLEHCNLLLFESNDCYQLIELTKLFPELDYLIVENKEKISGLGWEKLLIRNFEKYESICYWNKLTKKNWDNIIKSKPDL